MNITIEELCLLLGQKDVELYLLKKQLQETLEKLKEINGS